MLDKKIWKTINNISPGYVGSRRNQEWVKRDRKYGHGNWQMAWLVNGKQLDYYEACKLYEESYYKYFIQRPELLATLLHEARNIYDDNPQNVRAGRDYRNRGNIRTHIQDTTIRNCIKRFGKKFHGKRLIQIRDRIGKHPLSLALSPGQVPFYDQNLLSNPSNLKKMHRTAWWLPGSVEDFYQRAKRLCVNKYAKKN